MEVRFTYVKTILIPFYLKNLLIPDHNQLYNEQNYVRFHHSDTRNMIQKDLHTPYDSPEPDDKVSDDYRFSNGHVKTSFLFEKIFTSL